MEPLDPTTTLDTAAQWGPEIFLAVLVLLLFASFLFLFGKQMFAVIDNNTRALLEVAHMVAKTCDEIEEHEANTVRARTELHDMAERTRLLPNMDRKLDRLVDRE